MPAPNPAQNAKNLYNIKICGILLMTKGGVGKSTITFHLAMRYAELHPDINVLVIDLCPQANSSMMLLGGGNSGEDQIIDFCSTATPKSVVGYLSTVISNGRGATLPPQDEFVIKVSSLLIGNCLTQFEGPATAFAALSDATATSLFSIFQNHPEYFTTRSESICNKSDFINEFSLPLRDFNTAGVVCAHLGRKLFSMKQGYYEIYG